MKRRDKSYNEAIKEKDGKIKVKSRNIKLTKIIETKL